jgi:hypothetical protein
LGDRTDMTFDTNTALSETNHPVAAVGARAMLQP